MSAGYVGCLEGKRGNRLVGWTYDPARPAIPLKIRLLPEGGRSVELVADRHRADVHQHGHPNGYAAFSAPLTMLSGAGRIDCVWSDTGIPLPGSPYVPAPRRAVQAQADLGFLRIVVDVPDPGDWRITGWRRRACRSVAAPASPGLAGRQQVHRTGAGDVAPPGNDR